VFIDFCLDDVFFDENVLKSPDIIVLLSVTLFTSNIVGCRKPGAPALGEYMHITVILVR
jgi:hypothetical protein